MATDRLSVTFAAIADPTRRAILARLASGEATVTELAKPFDMTLPAVSKHLKVLEEADVRVGGALRIDMRGPAGEPFNGAVFPGRGVYREVVPNERLVFTMEPEIAGQTLPAVVMSVRFEDAAGGRTKVILHQTLDTV